MGTEVRCPVCGEGFSDRPPRCFRCETALGSWWRFEDELRALASVSGSPARGPRGTFVIAAALGLPALALSVALLTRPPALEVPPGPTRGPTPLPVAPEAPSSVRYTVQPGDSPWRIAAALTGQGSRWRELWPDVPPRLVPGMVLEVPVPR